MIMGRRVSRPDVPPTRGVPWTRPLPPLLRRHHSFISPESDVPRFGGSSLAPATSASGRVRRPDGNTRTSLGAKRKALMARTVIQIPLTRAT